MSETYRFSIEVVVHDPDTLARMARARAIEEGLDGYQWDEDRSGPADDLIMLLDPGSVPGCDVLESYAEQLS